MKGITCAWVEVVGGIIYLFQPIPFVFMNIDKGKRKKIRRSGRIISFYYQFATKQIEENRKWLRFPLRAHKVCEVSRSNFSFRQSLVGIKFHFIDLAFLLACAFYGRSAGERINFLIRVKLEWVSRRREQKPWLLPGDIFRHGFCMFYLRKKMLFEEEKWMFRYER